MPRFFYLIIALLLGALSWACTSSSPATRRVALPLSQGVDHGSVTLVFSRPVRGVVVSLDGRMVVDGANLQRLRMDGVETGYVNLAIAADGVERQARVWVDPGRVTSVPIGAAPQPPSQNPVLTAGISVLALLLSRSVQALLF